MPSLLFLLFSYRKILHLYFSDVHCFPGSWSSRSLSGYCRRSRFFVKVLWLMPVCVWRCVCLSVQCCIARLSSVVWAFKYTIFTHKINFLKHMHFNYHRFLFGNWRRAKIQLLIFSVSFYSWWHTANLLSYTVSPSSGCCVNKTFTFHN